MFSFVLFLCLCAAGYVMRKICSAVREVKAGHASSMEATSKFEYAFLRVNLYIYPFLAVTFGGLVSAEHASTTDAFDATILYSIVFYIFAIYSIVLTIMSHDTWSWERKRAQDFSFS
jgi:nitrate reductase NapE component